METVRIDEADENTDGERTWGVTTPACYLVVTESKTDRSLRIEALTGSPNTEEQARALGLVRRRRRMDKLITRIEVCDQLWRALVEMRTRTPAEPSSTPRLQGIQFMMDAVEAHRSAAQESLTGSTISCDNCGKPVPTDSIWIGKEESTLCQGCAEEEQQP